MTKEQRREYFRQWKLKNPGYRRPCEYKARKSAVILGVRVGVKPDGKA